MHCQWGPPKITAALPRDFVTLLGEERATAIGNVHRKSGKDRACGSRNIVADRQTDRQTCLSQYFDTAPADEVIKVTVSYTFEQE